MKHFTIAEMCQSSKAKAYKIDNTPNEQVTHNLTMLIEQILDPLREAYGQPIIVTSGYRCQALNKKVGGASTSQHCSGQAADIRCKVNTSANNKVLFDMVRELKLPFDQLINEYDYSWVHVSYSSRNRRQVLAAKKVNGKTIYTQQK